MPVDWTAEVADQIESHWRHQLRPRWDGMTDDEYFWQPVPGCWTLSPRGSGAAPTSLGGGAFTWDYGGPGAGEPVTTIAWRLAHLTVGLAEMNGTHFGGPPADVATFIYAPTADDALRHVDEAFEYWIRAVIDLGEAGLASPQGPSSPPEFADAPLVRLVMFTSVEVIHHGAEVCLLRDLYRERARADE